MLKQIEDSLQEFTATFGCGDRQEKLVFRTFAGPRSDFEIQEILSIYGDQDVMKFFGSEVTIDSVLEAEEWQSKLRKETSFEGAMKRMRWRLYYDRDMNRQSSDEIFIGFVSVSRVNRLMGPAICLLPGYQGQHLGTKVFLGLLARLLSNKAWFFSYFDGIKMTINPQNAASLGLKNAFLLKNDHEELNPKRTDGLWLYQRKGYAGNKSKSLIRRQFFCSSGDFLSNLLDSKTMVPLNRKRFILRLHCDNKVEQVVMTLVNSCRVGVQQLYLHPEDVRRLLKEFIWFRISRSKRKDNIMNNTFKVILPEEVLHSSSDHDNGMFIFFVLASNELQPQPFEITQTDDRRIRQGFVVFNRFTNKIKHFRLRMHNKSLDGVIAYLIHLDWDTFTRARAFDFALKNKIKGIWCTEQFLYQKGCYNSKYTNGTNEVTLIGQEWSTD